MILNRHKLTAALIALCSFIHNSAMAQKIVYRYCIHEEIAPGATRLTQQALAEAERQNASYILLDLDTYGGLVDDADRIRTMLLQTKIPTLAFIKNNAASAGALISIACDSIYMASGSTIGAACVVNQEGLLMPEKYQSYMRKKIRATAEETGRNPLIAEGMVDESIVIDSIKEKGKIVTFSVEEAIRYGYCNAKVENVQAIVNRLGKGFQLIDHQLSWLDKFILWLLTPAVSAIFLLGIFGGIYFEFKAPGALVPILVSVVCACLYFAPKYADGLATNWEIVLFFIGIILLLLEIFIIPGFGVAGILGITFTVGGLALAMVRNINFDFSWVPSGAFGTALLIVSLCMFVPLGLLLAFGQNIFQSPLLRKLSVAGEMKSASGYSVKEDKLNNLLGQEATCITDLRPQGKVEVANEIFEANAEGAFIAKGSTVKVIGTRGNYLVVR